MNTFGKLADIIIAGIIMFLLPLMYFEYKQTELLQRILLRRSENFIETARNHGAVTEAMYLNFLQELSITGGYLHCEIEVERKNYLPSDEPGKENPQSYIARYGHKDVIDVVQKHGLLRLWVEDDIIINIYSAPRLLPGREYRLVHIGGSV